ncbi:MAG: hypothetical protein NXH85_18250 [Pseudomonadaceae bacterium]|nr:hypothetical protein [Pseudomonadaceae bacterium]
MKSQSAPAKYLIFATVIVALVLPLSLATDMAAQDYASFGMRLTARLSAAFFLLAYVARPLLELTGVGRQLVRHRRYLGLAAALAHTVHAWFIYDYFRIIGESIEPLVLIGGGGAFIALWLMALTSNNASQRWLGANWQRLHRFGMHYLWLIFFQTLLGIALVNAAYWPAVAAFGLAALLRLRAWQARRKRASAAA